MQPVSGWLGKEFFHWDSLSADLQLAVRLKPSGKGFHAWKYFTSAPAFNLNGNGSLALLQNEIHFLVSFPPVSDLDTGTIAVIEQMRAYAGFDQASPMVAVLSGFFERA